MAGSITVDKWVEVDVDPDDILENMTDGDLKRYGLTRLEAGVLTAMRALRNHHETTHSGLITGCNLPPCGDLNFDAAELVRET